jgi:hypothetical protein
LGRTPVPRWSAVPSIDYVADEIERLCNMMAQEIEQRTCFARSRSEVHVGDPNRSVVTTLKHGLPSSIVSRTNCDTTIRFRLHPTIRRGLYFNRQSDPDFDNYTNSELRLKNEIAKSDECISKLLLAYERTATLKSS